MSTFRVFDVETGQQIGTLSTLARLGELIEIDDRKYFVAAVEHVIKDEVHVETKVRVRDMNK